ncbi:MAG: NADH-quinone oxidoreductase subunit NuoF [Anaerolineae bacterium]
MWEKILLKNVDIPNVHDIDIYLAHGGYRAVRKALLEFTPDELIEMVKKSGLRGRGGAGFPTGLKWSFMPKDPGVTKYLCVNSDEGEPGTFKDRYLMEKDPHQVLEGAIIAAYAVGAKRAYAYIRGEFTIGIKRFKKAVDEAYMRGFLGKNILGSGFDLDFFVCRGAGAYICGEETAMLDSIEGKRGEPRLKPPFPTQAGLYGQPTLINNVETLACVPHIILRGPEWFASIGTKESTGPKIFSVSGHVEGPGNYELPMGTPLREIIYDHAGGVRDGKKLKAVIPGGISTPMLTPEHLDVKMAFETLPEVGSMLGTGAIIVINESTCIINAVLHMARFFERESCAKCVPCRVGTHVMASVLQRIEDGEGEEGDIDMLLELCDAIRGKTFCPLGDAAINPVASSIKHFRDEYEYHIQRKKCMV